MGKGEKEKNNVCENHLEAPDFQLQFFIQGSKFDNRKKGTLTTSFRKKEAIEGLGGGYIPMKFVAV